VFDDKITSYKISLYQARAAFCIRRDSLNKPYCADFDILIIEVESKDVVKQFRATWYSFRSYKDQKYLIILDACKSVYKTLMNKDKHGIEKILNMK